MRDRLLMVESAEHKIMLHLHARLPSCRLPRGKNGARQMRHRLGCEVPVGDVQIRCDLTQLGDDFRRLADG